MQSKSKKYYVCLQTLIDLIPLKFRILSHDLLTVGMNQSAAAQTSSANHYILTFGDVQNNTLVIIIIIIITAETVQFTVTALKFNNRRHSV